MACCPARSLRSSSQNNKPRCPYPEPPRTFSPPSLLVSLSRTLRHRKATRTSLSSLTSLTKRLETQENRYAAVENMDVGNFVENVEIIGAYYDVREVVLGEDNVSP